MYGFEGNGVTVKMCEPGRTGFQVSPYCLGAMMFGQAGDTDRDDCVRIVHRALDPAIVEARWVADRIAERKRVAGVTR
ncbi:hypothetical protein ACFRMN_08885 [Streptomyces sp. NPDC056835]|uniref:hypothetical protein n=1 Tax=Streptomyces sp. NPDC056835 TaxID=3345956 RepID=UPI00368EB7C6